MSVDEGSSVREVVEWCGTGITVRGGNSAVPPGGRPAGRPMSVRRLSAAGLAALHRAVNDPTTVERFRSKVVQVPGSQCLWWRGAVSGRGHGRFWFGRGRVVIARRCRPHRS